MTKKITLSAIESFTGGLFASEIIKTPGASAFFKGSIVAYNNEVKEKIGVVTKNGVINSETALEMARQGNKFFKTDICVAFTGNAGPNAMEGKPVGNIFIAINEDVYEFNYPNLERNEIREKAVEFAIKKIKYLLFK